MQQQVDLLRALRMAVAAGVIGVSAVGFAQDKSVTTVPDAQVEANVLKALAGASDLADQSISTTTEFGVVTLSGTVRDEASRTKAEQLVANTQGVKKVVDELTIGGAPAVATAPAGQATADENNAEGSNPNLQSDGTMASGAPQTAQSPQSGQQPAYGQQPMPQDEQQPGAQQGQQQYPGPPPYRRPYSSPYGQQPAYAQQQPYQPLVPQVGGQTVVVPAGTVLMVRVNQAMDSAHTAPGSAFDGVVLQNVVIGNVIAIPRGAAVQGVVADSQHGGPFAGKGGLALEVTQVSMGGTVYPLTTSDWQQVGQNKTGQTAGNTIGMGAFGAMIGAIAGGGPGALLGAGIGSAAGLGVSAAQKNGEAKIPAEAILTFKLSQQTPITTVSQAELDKLGAGLPQPAQQLRRRYPAYPGYSGYPGYPPPPPPPGYYGPVYYPYAYYR